MGKIIEVKIDRFDGGLSEDKRVKDTSKYSLTKHFDALTYPHKLIPYVKTEPNESKALSIVKFIYAPWLSSGAFMLYGLGIASGSVSKPAVNTYDIDAGDPDNTGWGTPANNESAVSGRNTEVFFYYKQFIYMWTGGNKLVRFDTTVAAAFNDAYQTIAYTTVAEPVHHPADDIAYFFTDNKVHSLNDTTWSTAVLTLPTDLQIVAATAHGNYLAIACTTKGTADAKSITFLWDRDSSLTLLTERIDFGRGKIVHIASLDNKLIAVMDYFTNNLYSLSKGRVLIKQANGQFAATLKELTTDSFSNSLPRTRMVRDNKLYFPMTIVLNGDTRMGIWVTDSNGRVTLDTVEEEATSYEGIYATGNMWWIAHSGDGSVNRSDEDRVYSTTLASTYESLIFDGGDASLVKKLVGATVMTEPMPAAGQIVLKYRKDNETSWTTIFTNTTDNDISHSAINIESSGATLPEFKEIQFQILSTGGAVVTGHSFQAEVTGRRLY